MTKDSPLLAPSRARNASSVFGMRWMQDDARRCKVMHASSQTKAVPIPEIYLRDRGEARARLRARELFVVILLPVSQLRPPDARYFLDAFVLARDLDAGSTDEA